MNFYPLTEVIGLAVVMALTGSAQMALHYFPWQMMLGRPLRAPWSYVVGVAAMLGPYILLLMLWSLFPPQEGAVLWALAALLCVVFSSGGTVIGVYWLDEYLLARRKVSEMGEEQETMRGMIFE